MRHCKGGSSSDGNLETYRRTATKRRPSMYLAALGPTANEMETSNVEMDTSKGQGLICKIESKTKPSRKLKKPSKIVSSAWSMTDAFPTDARKNRILRYNESHALIKDIMETSCLASGRKSFRIARFLLLSTVTPSSLSARRYRISSDSIDVSDDDTIFW